MNFHSLHEELTLLEPPPPRTLPDVSLMHVYVFYCEIDCAQGTYQRRYARLRDATCANCNVQKRFCSLSSANLEPSRSHSISYLLVRCLHSRSIDADDHV